MYPVQIQACRVTGTTVSGPTGASSSPGPVLYVAFTQQLRSDLLTPRDREPCLVFDLNGTVLSAGYYICRLSASYTGLPVYEAMARASSSSGIVSINDNTVVDQTIGVGIAATGTGVGDNQTNITTTAPNWSSDERCYPGWIRNYLGVSYRLGGTSSSLSQQPSLGAPWINIGGDGLNIVNNPYHIIYTPTGSGSLPYRAIGNPNFELASDNIIISSDSITNLIKLLGTALVINTTNIFTYTYVENVIYFNTFNQTITIKIGNEYYFFYTDCCEGRKYYCLSKTAVQNCYNLTATEYALMLIDGFAYVSGPHDTKVLCLASCSSVPKTWWCLVLSDVSSCFELTEAQLFAKIDDDGYFPQSGPHATEAECLAICSSPVTTACCPEDPTPTTLYGVLTGASGGCECLNGVPFTLTYDSGDDQWNVDGEVITDCATISTGIFLWCDSGTWNVDVDGVGHCPTPGFNVVTLVSCDPLVLTITVSVLNCGCGSSGTATLTITEVAP